VEVHKENFSVPKGNTEAAQKVDLPFAQQTDPPYHLLY
jgi:hypothetical protein